MVASGNRTGHVTYDGETVLYISTDGGATWGTQSVINTTEGIDYRDAGILYLGNNQFLLNYFTAYEKDSARVTANSYVRKGTLTGGAIVWADPVQVPIQSPHGPALLQDGTLLWVGDAMFDPNEGYDKNGDNINDYTYGNEYALKSTDGGLTWSYVAGIPDIEGVGSAGCEYNTVQTANGKLITSIRLADSAGILYTYITRSTDSGKTWSTPELVTCGAPAHLLCHSSGTIVMTYGFRGDGADDEAFGIRARLSYDEGVTWSEEIVLDGTAYKTDCGYPASVELANGSIYTVYYKLERTTEIFNTKKYEQGIYSVLWSLNLQSPES